MNEHTAPLALDQPERHIYEPPHNGVQRLLFQSTSIAEWYQHGPGTESEGFTVLVSHDDEMSFARTRLVNVRSMTVEEVIRLSHLTWCAAQYIATAMEDAANRQAANTPARSETATQPQDATAGGDLT